MKQKEVKNMPKQKRGGKGGQSSGQSKSRGRGWFGDSDGHRRAGSMSSGNRGPRNTS